MSASPPVPTISPALAVSTAQHIGARKSQQDALAVTSCQDAATHRGLLLLLCDGMGGLADGDLAASTAVETFLAAYGDKREAESVAEALLRSLRSANSAVAHTAGNNGSNGRCGTTLVAATIQEGCLHWVSVGDSGLFLIRNRRVLQLNEPHVFGRLLDARVLSGDLDAATALFHPQRDALTSYVGGPQLGDVDVNLEPLPLLAGDVVFVASDGLFKSISEEEILDAVCDAGPAGPAAALVDAAIARKRRNQDNVSVCAVTLGTAAGADPGRL